MFRYEKSTFSTNSGAKVALFSGLTAWKWKTKKKQQKNNTSNSKLMYCEKLLASTNVFLFLKSSEMKCPNTPRVHANWGKSTNDDWVIRNFSPVWVESGQHRFFSKYSKPANYCIWHLKLTAQKGFSTYIFKTQPKYF